MGLFKDLFGRKEDTRLTFKFNADNIKTVGDLLEIFDFMSFKISINDTETLKKFQALKKRGLLK